MAFIGDVVRSRDLARSERSKLQSALELLMDRLNERFAHAIAARFTVTLGDEFQGLLSSPDPIPDVLHLVEHTLDPVRVRAGIGLGSLATPLKPTAIGMDGPAFHSARYAIDTARKSKLLGGVFAGFSDTHDEILNGYARILWYHRSQWSPGQREVAARLWEGKSQTEVAQELGVSRQAVHARVTGAGWDAFRAATTGWRAALSLVLA
ncbi:MAG: hypothetical protein JO306_12255 [Gemmatimonadetes bacterium]|nr:hypothetical protein [Gemmatimonadota bacterium]